MAFTIPKTLQIGGLKIKVEQKDTVICDGEVVLGQAAYKSQSIELSNTCNQEYKEMVFFHELMHMILHFSGDSELCKDERFIDRVSGSLYQAIKTMK